MFDFGFLQQLFTAAANLAPEAVQFGLVIFLIISAGKALGIIKPDLYSAIANVLLGWLAAGAPGLPLTSGSVPSDVASALEAGMRAASLQDGIILWSMVSVSAALFYHLVKAAPSAFASLRAFAGRKK
jgi:hypothetical protein